MRLPPAHVAVPAELIERLPSLKGSRTSNEKSFATMWAAGWSGAQWVYLLALLFMFVGCILADGRAENGSVPVSAPVSGESENGKLDGKDADSSGRQVRVGGGVDDGKVCWVGDWRVVQAEVFGLGVCDVRWGAAAGLTEQMKSGETAPSATASQSGSETAVPTSADHELDTDSLLDNANFLSFEDWKKQNLAKAGQSADAVGGRPPRAEEAAKDDRRRPTGINNALESLGEDAEIELDFGGFGAGSPEATKPASWAAGVPSADGRGERKDAAEVDVNAVAQGVPATDVPHGRDAGTTCKERFNYASFDCAATVLKTNPECQGSSSILTENKDSYMLNECRANNKFLILELCDDILVDTVVLANYEFFSSIFHTFRVSVADRYPAKPDQWKELGIYEARNTREVQAFAIQNPLIWARYLKIELLTHYGSEFYCPLSLVRVHGTTMLEEYKHEGEVARAGVEAIEAGPSVPEAEGGDASGQAIPEAPREDVKESKKAEPQIQDVCPNKRTPVETLLLGGTIKAVNVCGVDAGPVKEVAPEGTVPPSESIPSSNGTVLCAEEPSPVAYAPEVRPKEKDAEAAQRTPGRMVNVTSSTTTPTVSETAQQNTTAETSVKPATPSKEAKEEQVPPPETTRPSTTQPPAPNPTTQESFFKSVNKRLQMLESNSTLSLLYIEEQSRILRDAFSKVEKRQLGKTSTFLENLNVTVLNELKQFREQYDQVWKSVVFEFENQRIQYHQEIYAISSQLGVLADELVFQKRVSVIQSLMVLFCFGLVLFSRGAVSNYIEFPRVQNMVSRSYSFRSSSPVYGSASGSPASTRPTSSHRDGNGHRRNLSDDSQDAPVSPTIAYSPPTPESSSASGEGEKIDQSQESLQVPEMDPAQFRSQSTPPLLSGNSGDLDEDEGLDPS